MKSYRIAVVPGDGIGTEVTTEAVRVLDAVSHQHEFTAELTEFPWGADYWEQTGKYVPDDFLDVLQPFDAILLGAFGWPEKVSDHVSLAPLVRVRQAFDQYACVRPARLFSGVPGVLQDKGPSEIDFVVIRENSEGEYVDSGGRFKVGKPDEFALQTAIHTRKGIDRILRFGFETARRRRKRLTMITKSNAQKYGYVLWDEILDEVRPDFPDVSADRQHADAAAMNLVRRPEQFDVIVASNLFGDLLTDLGGVIAGGLGLAPSTNTNPERKYPSMFEPVHGSAPDIAGSGTANPVAAILSVALMLDWLGAEAAAESIRSGVESTLASGVGTPDLGGTLTTSEMAGRVLEQLQR